MVRDVPGLHDVKVTRDDDGTVEPSKEARQPLGDGLLERSLVLVPPLLRAAGRHIQAEQADALARQAHLCGRSAVRENFDAARYWGKGRPARSEDGAISSKRRPGGEHGLIATLREGGYKGGAPRA
jgi:hypothetical protein